MNEWARRTQQSEDVSTALSALDLTPCESELLSRAQIAGCVGTVPTRTSEWSRKELADAADNLTHFGLLQQAPSGASVVPGSDIPGATTQKARHDDSAAGAAAATRREQLHAAIMRRLDVVPSRLGVTRDME
ncbi:MAG: hypothetical protein QOF57_2604, partial [Frankiaceae bacterium]|nr:hypothetical protein [Frankiaceae bacterium]